MAGEDDKDTEQVSSQADNPDTGKKDAPAPKPSKKGKNDKDDKKDDKKDDQKDASSLSKDKPKGKEKEPKGGMLAGQVEFLQIGKDMAEAGKESAKAVGGVLGDTGKKIKEMMKGSDSKSEPKPKVDDKKLDSASQDSKSSPSPSPGEGKDEKKEDKEEHTPGMP